MAGRLVRSASAIQVGLSDGAAIDSPEVEDTNGDGASDLVVLVGTSLSILLATP